MHTFRSICFSRRCFCFYLISTVPLFILLKFSRRFALYDCIYYHCKWMLLVLFFCFFFVCSESWPLFCCCKQFQIHPLRHLLKCLRFVSSLKSRGSNSVSQCKLVSTFSNCAQLNASSKTSNFIMFILFCHLALRLLMFFWSFNWETIPFTQVNCFIFFCSRFLNSAVFIINWWKKTSENGFFLEFHGDYRHFIGNSFAQILLFFVEMSFIFFWLVWESDFDTKITKCKTISLQSNGKCINSNWIREREKKTHWTMRCQHGVCSQWQSPMSIVVEHINNF